LSSAVLPSPPSDDEKYSYVRRHLGVLVVCSIISVLGMSVSMVRFSAQAPEVWVFFGALAATIVYFVVSLPGGFTRDFDLEHHRALVDTWHPDHYPSIDVFLPTCGEDIAMLRNSCRYVAELDYPGTVTVYCLDDAGSADVAVMAADFGFVYLCRPNRGWFRKAGNLMHGFESSEGEYIAIFDADFCPRRDFLLELLPYLDCDPRLGIVQSPQFFDVLVSQNWLERGAGAVQEYFYRAVQTSRERRDGAICVGSNAIYRRAALVSNGGPTLIEHSEDVHTGFDLRRNGWRLQYVPIPLAKGLCPAQLGAFFRQQYRWCSGSMSLLSSKKFWATKIRFGARLCYLSGICYYLHTALFTIVGPLIPLVMLYGFRDHIRIENYIFLAPGFVFGLVVFPLWHHHRYRLETWSVKMIYGWAHLFAVIDRFRGTTVAWSPTGKEGTSSRSDVLRFRAFRLGVVLWGGSTAMAWIGGAVWSLRDHRLVDFIPIILLGLFYGLVVVRVLLPLATPMLTPPGAVERRDDGPDGDGFSDASTNQEPTPVGEIGSADQLRITPPVARGLHKPSYGARRDLGGLAGRTPRVARLLARPLLVDLAHAFRPEVVAAAGLTTLGLAVIGATTRHRRVAEKASAPSPRAWRRSTPANSRPASPERGPRIPTRRGRSLGSVRPASR
jgi:cellulose synthase (UDP-forming)